MFGSWNLDANLHLPVAIGPSTMDTSEMEFLETEMRRRDWVGEPSLYDSTHEVASGGSSGAIAQA